MFTISFDIYWFKFTHWDVRSSVSYIIMFLVILKWLNYWKCYHLISWHNINIIYFESGSVDSSECRTQLIKLAQVSIRQIKHLKFLPLPIHQSPSECLSHDLTAFFFPPHSLALFFFSAFPDRNGTAMELPSFLLLN